MMFGAQTEIVDEQRRATRVFFQALMEAMGTSSTSVPGRVTALEAEFATLSAGLASLSATVLSLSATVASNSSAIADLQVAGVFVTPWP